MPSIITLTSNIPWETSGWKNSRVTVTRPVYDCVGVSSNSTTSTTAHFNIWANGLSSVDGTLMPYRNDEHNVPYLFTDNSGNTYSAGTTAYIKPVVAINNRHCVLGPPEPPLPPVELPDYTFRFQFSNTSYNPTNVTGWKSGSTWTKVTTNDGTNQWDYTHVTANWDDEFNGKFSAADNLVDILYAGDFAGVTSMANKEFINSKVAGGTFGGKTSTGKSYIRSVCTFDTSNVKNMNGLFFHCPALAKVPKLNTSACSSFWSMFDSDTSLQWADGFDFSNAVILRSMFANCSLRILPSFSSVNPAKLNGSAQFLFQKNEYAGEYGSPGISAAYKYLSACPNIKYNQNTFDVCGSATQAGQAERALIPTGWKKT